jgi:threonine aldolase
MTFFNVTRTGHSAPELAKRMAREGVLIHATAPERVRLVTHLDVSREQVLAAIETFKRVLMTV